MQRIKSVSNNILNVPRTSSKGRVSLKQLSHTSLTTFSAVSASGHAGFAATDSAARRRTQAYQNIVSSNRKYYQSCTPPGAAWRKKQNLVSIHGYIYSLHSNYSPGSVIDAKFSFTIGRCTRHLLTSLQAWCLRLLQSILNLQWSYICMSSWTIVCSICASLKKCPEHKTTAPGSGVNPPTRVRSHGAQRTFDLGTWHPLSLRCFSINTTAGPVKMGKIKTKDRTDLRLTVIHEIFLSLLAMTGLVHSEVCESFLFGDTDSCY